jgi:predicted nucleic acid-binding protein
MNRGWVIDATIGVSWVHHKQSTAEAADLLRQADRGASIVVPPLWFPEMANVLLVLQRRGVISPGERKAGLRVIANMNFAVDDAPANTALGVSSDLAETQGLTVYDATYLEVALRRGMGLATRDVPLNRAAKACGVTTL